MAHHNARLTLLLLPLVLVLVATVIVTVPWQNSHRSTALGVVVSRPHLHTCSNSNSFSCSAAANISAYRSEMLGDFTYRLHTFEQEDWLLFKPIISCPADRPLTKYGEGDGSKLLCQVKPKPGQQCAIYSLGSKGDYQFERSMLAATQCHIHTFDCTYDGKSMDGGRHQYHKWCIGNGTGQFRTWANVTSSLGHKHVDVLKRDIEGHEYPVLSSFRDQDALPEELSLEIHIRMARFNGVLTPETTGEQALVFLHMANLGYAPYSQEVNALAPYCCCEFTFMRVATAKSSD